AIEGKNKNTKYEEEKGPTGDEEEKEKNIGDPSGEPTEEHEGMTGEGPVHDTK
ncbi:hypothetical protein KI387_028036, partial [Taxus chinensis]